MKKKDETEITQIKKIREKLFPGGSLQERNESFLPLYLKWGSEIFDILYREFDPLNNQFTILVEETV
ncbi:MAG: bacillithiol biosynthesis BshC [Bacteroidetes bacterium]|nr:bacillithiol biosynthesis BshC [Bacteroidota bacterium]